MSCWLASEVLLPRSIRRIIASPMPLSATTAGQQDRVGVRREEPDGDVADDAGQRR